MAKRKCAACSYDLVEVRGHFAMVALAELNADPSWERLVVGLASLFAEPPEVPL